MSDKLTCPNCGHEQEVTNNLNVIKCSVCNKTNRRDEWRKSNSKEINDLMKKKIIKLLEEVGRKKDKEKSMGMVIEYLEGVFND